MSNPAAMPAPALSVEQAAAALGIGRTTLWMHLRAGTLESVSIGRLRRIPRAEVDRALREGLPPIPRKRVA
jgi:excisionase family DNA binding protein